MKQPDAFEKMVESIGLFGGPQDEGILVDGAMVCKLLRRQHARVVKLVRTFDDGVFLDNEWIQKDLLLAALAKMKKGTP